MKLLLIAAGIASFSLLAGISLAHASCRVTVAANVEVSGEFSLADLLDGGSCAEVRRAAAKVLLGSAPLAGSKRVVAGSEVRTTLEKLAANLEAAGASVPVVVLVPERITVRRAGARASCADITRWIHRASPGAVDCGAADRIPQDAALEFSRPDWDPALGSWQLYARCVHPADCVPFVVRLTGHSNENNENNENEDDAREQTGTAAGELRGKTVRNNKTVRNKMIRSTLARLAAASAPSPTTALGADRALPLVRPGQTVTLLWDQDGIRLVVPAVCLDRGAPGENVRARMGHGGAVVRAIVVSAGMLRAAS
jgi:Chaperone for flagella basal body P-ring formation